jgi:hypothetical protein
MLFRRSERVVNVIRMALNERRESRFRHRQRYVRWRSGVFALILTSFANVSVSAAEPRDKIGINAIAIAGANRADFGIAMLEARAKLSEHVLVTVAPTIAAFEGADTERQIRAAVTLMSPAGPLLIDDRNLWVFSDSGTTRYRNRLRLTAPVQAGGRAFRLQLLNEAFYEQGGRGWFRNLFGAGVGLDVEKSFSLDAYWQVQDDAGVSPASIVYIVLTAHLR